MRLKKIKNAYEIISKIDNFIKNPFEYKGNWKKVFENENNIELEIGMGKGDFIIQKALENPNINYIGLEKYDSVLVGATKKIEKMNIPNLRIINADALGINDIFDKEISKIYLNFSDPWPKKRHEKRRLTYEKFLEMYDKIFLENIDIEFKTDNDELFNYSVESFVKHGLKIKKINTNIDAKYKTEYEKKFIEKGKNINFVQVCSKIK